MNPYLKNLNRIEFVVTYACTGRCIHCSEGDHTGCTEFLDGDIAANAVANIAEKYQIESLMTFGGEPLLHPEAVCKIHTAAKNAGIPRRQLITNGYFSKDPAKIAAVAAALAQSGVNDVLLSVDAFHQETIPLEPVQCFARELLRHNVPLRLQPAWLVSEEDDNPYNVKTRGVLAQFSGIAVGSGNVIFPSGNAAKYLAEYFDPAETYTNPYEDDPADIRSVGFEPDGSVLQGNVYRDDILNILAAYSPEND